MPTSDKSSWARARREIGGSKSGQAEIKSTTGEKIKIGHMGKKKTHRGEARECALDKEVEEPRKKTEEKEKEGGAKGGKESNARS